MRSILSINDKKWKAVNFDDGTLSILFNKECYDIKAIRASAYKFTDNFAVQIDQDSDKNIRVEFRPLDKLEVELQSIANQFLNTVIDQQVRIDLEIRYGNIRDIIVDAAFNPAEQNYKKKIKWLHGLSIHVFSSL